MIVLYGITRTCAAPFAPAPHLAPAPHRTAPRIRTAPRTHTAPNPSRQVEHRELLNQLREEASGGQMRRSSTHFDSRPQRRRPSRSRSPIRRSRGSHHRSRSPETSRKPSFRSSGSKPGRLDRLSACPICLSRKRHQIASCQSAETWDKKKVRCSRNERGRIINNKGIMLCSDWQRPNRCENVSSGHVHECSGCGASQHGADSCPLAES